MFNRHDSDSNILKFKKYQFSPFINERYNINIENSNNLMNSGKYYYENHRCYHFPHSLKSITTSSTGINSSNLYKNLNNNKTELKNEDIKKVLEAIEGIKANQKELISAIKDLNLNKDNNHKNEQKKEEKNVENELLSYINNLNSDFESIKNEILILKQKDLENQKIIEMNKIEIDNLKRNNQSNSNDVHYNTLNEKNKKIKQLEESLNESKKQNSNLQQQLSISQDLNNKKDEEIKSLEKELSEFKVKSVNNNDIDQKKLSDILTNLNVKVDSIQKSIEENIIHNSLNNNLTKSTSIFNVGNSNIIQSNGKLKIPNSQNNS